MSQQVYIISTVTYEDACINEVLIATTGHDLKALHGEFRSLIDYPTNYGDYMPQDGDPLFVKWEGKRNLLAQAYQSATTNEDVLFSEWLIRNHGFKRIEWDEVDL